MFEVKGEKMNLPNDWIQCNLTDICSIRTGKYDANHAVENGKYRFYTCSTTYSFCNTKSFEGECIIVPGNGDIGQVYYYDGELEVYQRTYVLEKICILPRYLYYHLFWNWRHINSDKQYGSTIRYVRIGNFEKYIVSLPPLPEQHRIVAKIDALFSELDNGVAFLKTIKAQLAIYRQAVLKWAFEGKKDYVSFGEITEMRLGKMLDKNKNKGIPEVYLRNINVRWFDFDLDDLLEMKFEEDEEDKYSIKKGDLIICEGGEPGRCAIWKSDETIKYQKALHRVRPKEDWRTEYLMYYMKYITNTGVINSFFTGTGIKHLTGESLKKILVPICPKPEQLAIVSAIESRLSVCDKLEQTIDQTLALSASLRQSILKKAFEGRLVPQDPNDEPAEKLLERIKAEKAAVLTKQKQTRKRSLR